MNESKKNELGRYDELVKKLCEDAEVECHLLAADILYIKGNRSKLTASLLAASHGDEPMGVQVLADLMERILHNKNTQRPNLYIILANREAYRKHVRFIESDLNRQYGKKDESIESQRASEISRVLDQSDFCLDIHQTIEKSSKSFFIIPENASKAEILCSYLNKDLPVLLNSFSDKVTTSSSYMDSMNKIGLTLELTGGDDFDDYARKCGADLIGKVFLLSSLDSLPVSQSKKYSICYTEPYLDEKVTFRKGFQNWDYVKKDEAIGSKDSREMFCRQEGWIFLYPRSMLKPELKPLGIYFILKEI